MITTQQLNRFACRAIWEMRKTQRDYWFVHPQIRIQRPRFKPYNDFFEVYWESIHLGNMLRPGCGRDWELYIESCRRSTMLFRVFCGAIHQTVQNHG
jgi:hypothetical protein